MTNNCPTFPTLLAWLENDHNPNVEEAVYVNNLGEEEQERVKAAYGPNYDRLVDLKNKYDPTNLFSLNQKIKPTM